MADVAKHVVRDEPGGEEEEEEDRSLGELINEELKSLGKKWLNAEGGWSTVEEVAREIVEAKPIAESTPPPSPAVRSSPPQPLSSSPEHVSSESQLTPQSDSPLTPDSHQPRVNGHLEESLESVVVSETSIENCDEPVHEESLVNSTQGSVNEEVTDCIESVLDGVVHVQETVTTTTSQIVQQFIETEISESSSTVVEKKKKKKSVGSSETSEEIVTGTKKKTKKSKKSEGKENHISVIENGHGSEEIPSSPSPSSMSPVEDDDLSNVCVKDLKLNYVNEASKSFTASEKSAEVPVPPPVSIRELRRSFGDIHKACENADSIQTATNNYENQMRARSLGDLTRIGNHRKIVTGVSVKELAARYWRTVSIENNLNDSPPPIGRLDKSSFSKFDQLSKKTVLHVRSSDPAKAQKTFSQGSQDGQTAVLCKACQKQVFAMEQIKAERAVWHKNCFRCHTCNKQLTVDIYQSHEGELYCKPHFRELFQPKAVIDNEEDIHASDKPDLGLEELSSLNVKSRFQVFEKQQDTADGELERSPTTVSVKRSSSILSKLAKFQKKGMDVGVTDESLNGFVYEETSSSEEESGEDEEEDQGVIKCRRKARERPVSFGKMDDVKRNWESVNQSQRREEMREERKQELQQIRSRLFQGKQGKMKELYEQAVAESESKGGKKETEELASLDLKAKLVRERFEKGETGAGDNNENKKAVEEDMAVFEEGISKKSRSIFLEMEAAAKASPTLPNQNLPARTDSIRRPREAYYKREPSQSDDIVRSSDVVEDVAIETADLSSRFKFFETYKEPEKQKKTFRITPPREGQVKTESPERDVYRDPDVVRCEDKIEDESAIKRSQTASRMLSVFRQLEEQKEVLPDGPKPKKCFTPPPDYKGGSDSSEEEGSEEEEDEETEEEEEESETEDGVVKSSYKVKDEFLEQSRNAARAKQLAAKFEQWEPEKQSTNNAINMLDSEHASIESTKSLKARFESLQNEQPKEKARPKVNRFVEQPTSTLCAYCETKVYPLEKIETNGKVFHKNCFRCSYCNCILRIEGDRMFRERLSGKSSSDICSACSC